MERKTYYVSVQAASILENQGDAAYEFEVQATNDEIIDLQEAFNLLAHYDNATAIRGIIPGIPYHQDEENDNYDYMLAQVYRKLHAIGNEEAKQTIDAMGIMQRQIFED